MYTVKEAAERLGISPHTVRCYTNQELTPHPARDENGVRRFSDAGLAYLQVAVYPRNCGMPIQKIREYFALSEQGDATIQERYAMLLAQRDQIDRQLSQTARSRDCIQQKLAYYAAFMGGPEHGEDAEA